MSLINWIRNRFGREVQVGLALGSGGARGMAHIGVLKVLEDEGIPIHCIAGTSAGALIGGLYAAGNSPKAIEELVSGLSIAKIAKIFFPSMGKGGLIDGSRAKAFIRPMLEDRRIEELRPAFACVACDLHTGDRVVLRKGDLLESIRASISIPGIFTPVVCCDRTLIDGGVVDPLPIDLAYEMGADFVVAVHVGRQSSKSRRGASAGECVLPCTSSEEDTLEETSEDGDWIRKPCRQIAASYEKAKDRRRTAPTLVEVLLSTASIYETRLTELNLSARRERLLVEPTLEDIEILDFHKSRQAIEAGEEAMRDALPRLFMRRPGVRRRT